MKTFDVNIDMNWSKSYIIKAKTKAEAKKKAWDKFAKHLPKKQFTTHIDQL